jgi:UDP-glucose 4-epimerase
MKAIVFGGSGFLGSHTADALSDAGHDVTVCDVQESAFLTPNQRFLRVDILDAEAVMTAVSGHDVIYNFAALADIDQCRNRPADTVRQNILGNVNILEAARHHGVKRYVFASTIYVHSESGGFYRVSKQACELYVEEYQRAYDVDYTILRYGTLYGRRSNEHNSVYRYLRQALFDRRIVGYGTGDEIREYIHVEDAARLGAEVLSDEFANQQVIISGHQRTRFRDLLMMIREIVGDDVEVELRLPEPRGTSPGESAHYSLTPYAFRPRTARKLHNLTYMDMGQGLVECLEEMYRSHVEKS